MRTTRWILTTVVMCWLLAGPCQAFYNPEKGRWLTRDPIEERGGPNLHSLLANTPVNQVDRLGLIGDPGPDPWRHKLVCCRCVSVEVRFHNGGESFQWGWRPPNRDLIEQKGALSRYGDDMFVTWTVEGNPRKCTFYQDETGPNIFTAFREDPPGVKDAQPGAEHLLTPDTAAMAAYRGNTFSYIDAFGPHFYAGDEGNWKIAMDFTAVLRCLGSDGRSMSRTIPFLSLTEVFFPP